MGSGRSGIYYTSHGSAFIHHDALIHVMEGEYDPYKGKPSLLINGGHGQDSMDFMDKNDILYEVTKTYDNGIRVGNVLDSEQPFRQQGSNHSWFPKNWTTEKVTAAANVLAANCRIKEL